VFLTAFNPEQLITKTNQLPRTDMRDSGVLNFYNKIVDKLSETDSEIKDALDSFNKEKMKERVTFFVSAGVTSAI